MEEFLAGTIRLAAPLILAALGEMVVQRAGVINIGIEGIMLAGAFAGLAAGHASGSAGAGVVAAAAAGLSLGVFFALLCVTVRADQIVTGTGLNIAMLGLTGALFRSMYGIEASVTAPGLREWELPLVSQVPLIGQALFNQSALVYGAGLAAAALWWFLRSPYGLGLRACGSNPGAADAAGVRVDRVRWAAVVFGATMAGIAGGYLTLVQTNTFAENMTSGRGFIALAVVVFGRWSPVGVVAAAMVFGAANQAQFWFQARGSELDLAVFTLKLPYQALLALPYAATLAVLAVFAGNHRGPKTLGQPYVRGS